MQPGTSITYYNIDVRKVLYLHDILITIVLYQYGFKKKMIIVTIQKNSKYIELFLWYRHFIDNNAVTISLGKAYLSSY